MHEQAIKIHTFVREKNATENSEEYKKEITVG